MGFLKASLLMALVSGVEKCTKAVIHFMVLALN